MLLKRGFTSRECHLKFPELINKIIPFATFNGQRVPQRGGGTAQWLELWMADQEVAGVNPCCNVYDFG